MTMTMGGITLREQRDAMAVAIARKVVAGEPVPDWAVEDFAATDAELRNAPGAAFGL